MVQIYLRDEFSRVTRPVKELKGFERLTLGPGERRKVSFSVGPEQLRFFNRPMERVVEPGEFGVAVGTSSEDLRAEGRFRIDGAVRELPPREIVPTAVRITAAD